MSIRKACSNAGLSRTVQRYQAKPRDDRTITERLLSRAKQYPRYGFGKMFPIIRRQGHPWNHKRVYRIYGALKLNFRRKGKKRLPNRHPQPLVVPDRANECWSADFMSNALYSGQRFRTFNVVDDDNRECLAIEIDTNLPAARIIRGLDRTAAWRGYPRRLRLDNGPELVSLAMAPWAEDNDIQLDFIQPGIPMPNSSIERFNRTYRETVWTFMCFQG